jgi:hypothetical protein
MGGLDGYRRNWPRIGGLIGMGVGAAVALGHRRMSRPQLISALNFGALQVHQYEEYQDPGYFPGQFNRDVFHSDRPDRYPVNTNVAMIVNTALGYPFYLLPVVFPKKRWLGIAPVLFGIGQAGAHGIVFPRLAKARYSPGFLASIFLHVPLGIEYLRALHAERPIERPEWKNGVLYTVAFAVGGLAVPNVVFRDRDSPYRFTAHQVGGTSES